MLYIFNNDCQILDISNSNASSDDKFAGPIFTDAGKTDKVISGSSKTCASEFSIVSLDWSLLKTKLYLPIKSVDTNVGLSMRSTDMNKEKQLTTKTFTN